MQIVFSTVLYAMLRPDAGIKMTTRSHGSLDSLSDELVSDGATEVNKVTFCVYLFPRIPFRRKHGNTSVCELELSRCLI